MNRCNSGWLGNQICITHAFVGIAIRSLSHPKIGGQFGGFREEGLCECNCLCAYSEANEEGRSDCRSGVDVRIAASARYDDLGWSATRSETEGASSIFELTEFFGAMHCAAHRYRSEVVIHLVGHFLVESIKALRLLCSLRNL